ncbi:hypothetical protein DL93DRAFT_1115408 [Clavulina sp. PMI_390]|nr:hypothetical protein DL93DRAFT_1115408 [Clavulina sp. PMI_390]
MHNKGENAPTHLQTPGSCPIAMLTSSLLSDIFFYAAMQSGQLSKRRIDILARVCSSWHQLVNETSELYTDIFWLHPTAVRFPPSYLYHMRSWRLRAKGRPLHLKFNSSCVEWLINPHKGKFHDYSRRLSSDVRAVENVRHELKEASLACWRLDVSLKGDMGEAFSRWLSQGNCPKLKELVLHGNTIVHIPSSFDFTSIESDGSAIDHKDKFNAKTLTWRLPHNRAWRIWPVLAASHHGLEYLKLFAADIVRLHDGTRTVDNKLVFPCLHTVEFDGSSLKAVLTAAECQAWVDIFRNFDAPRAQVLRLINFRMISEDATSFWEQLVSVTVPFLASYNCRPKSRIPSSYSYLFIPLRRLRAFAIQPLSLLNIGNSLP